MTILYKGILKAMRYLMPLIYLAVGLVLIFTKFPGNGAGKYRLPLGILLIGYSVFRAWRILKENETPEENENSTD